MQQGINPQSLEWVGFAHAFVQLKNGFGRVPWPPSDPTFSAGGYSMYLRGYRRYCIRKGVPV